MGLFDYVLEVIISDLRWILQKYFVKMQLSPSGALRGAATTDLKAFIHLDRQAEGDSNLEDHPSLLWK